MTETEAMDAVRPYVRKAAQRVHRRVPYMDVEEMIEEMTPTALKAIRAYRKGKQSLGSWVYVCVWRTLTACIRRQLWQHRFSKGKVELLDQAGPQKFDLDRLMGEVSGPARVAIRAAIDKETKGGTLHFLTKELAWEKSLLAQVMREIREVM